MKVSDLKTHEEVLAEHLQDPEFRREWERTRFADAVATRILAYRVDQGLTQTELAKRLGMNQSAVARLEAGDHEPSLATLRRLAQVLGLEFHIDITPDTISLTA